MKNSFIAQKFKQLKKDQKYGFSLKEVESKITKEIYGEMINKLAKWPPENKCGYCTSNKL